MDDETTESGSEFGAGIVVCLAKFSEHLWNDFESRINNAIRWSKMSEAERSRELAEATRYPRGDAARRIDDINSIFRSREFSDENNISYEITVWANGASDHFYDLDREKAPPSLIELADLMLKIGHGFTNDIWTEKTLIHIRDLWKRSCLEVDRMLGTEPDWGQW